MTKCKRCDLPMDWGSYKGKWVPLVPIEDASGLPCTFVDDNGGFAGGA